MRAAGAVWSVARIDYDLEVDLGVGFGGVVDWLPGGRGGTTGCPWINVEGYKDRDSGGGRLGQDESGKHLNGSHDYLLLML